MNHRQQQKMPAPKKLAAATWSALSVMAMLSVASQAAYAQTEPEPVKLQRVEITGSSIKRIDAETALPVQILTRDQIEKTGVTTAAELLGKISGSTANLTDGASFSDVGTQRGFNGANLRGIGVSSTLVLLNGRRLANFASPGAQSGVDLNSIPSAAIQRVEVLKDGASAIYGADAIGGVINFITRTDFEGAEASVYYGDSQRGGAGKTTVSLSGGIGNLSNDRYNLFGVFNYQKSDPLNASQRRWIGSPFQEDINLDVSSSNTFPANVRRTTASNRTTGPRLNPSAPACNPPATIYEPNSFVGSAACLYNYLQATQIYPESDRYSGLVRGQFAIDANNTLFAEVLYGNTQTTYRISPQTVTDINYPLGGPFYPTALVPTNQTPLRVSLRLTEAGPRTNEVEAVTQRYIFGAKGTLAGWDYDTAYNHSLSKVDDKYIDGYVLRSAFNTAFATGNINPFGPSNAAGAAALEASRVRGAVRKSEATTDLVDFKVTREVLTLPGGNVGLALGTEYRREKLDFSPSAVLASGDVRGEGAVVPYGGSRNVYAFYGEVNVPVLKTLELQAALRYDHYNDVGSTTNPKFGALWKPLSEVAFRGSYSEGFRAPSLADTREPSRVGQVSGIYNDPLGCIRIGNIDNTRNPDFCGIQPDLLRGGTANLKPETSSQYSAGIVLEPVRDLTASVDYFRIKKSDTLISNEGTYFQDPTNNANAVVRAPVNPALPGFPGEIVSVDGRVRNIGSLETSGLDVNLGYRLPKFSWGRLGANINGTYVFDFKTRNSANSPVVNSVGAFVDTQVVQRWRHTLTFDYDIGDFGASLQQTFYSGYRDQTPLQDGSIRRVEAYKLWDLSGSYKIIKGLTLRAGVKNLFDRDPPRSNQVFSFLAGYDSSYTDPRGRFFYGSLSYAFK